MMQQGVRVDGPVVGVNLFKPPRREGTLCASITKEKKIHLHELQRGQRLAFGANRNSGPSFTPLCSSTVLQHEPTALSLLSASLLVVGTDTGDVLAFQISSDEEGNYELVDLDVPESAHSHTPVTSMSGHASSSLIAIAGGRSLTLLSSPASSALANDAGGDWDAQSFGESKHGGLLSACAFMDATSIVTGSDVGIVEMWDTRSPESASITFQNSLNEDGSLQVVCSIAAHVRDGNVLASGNDEGLVVFWDIRNQQLPLAQLQAHEAPVWDIAFSSQKTHTLYSSGEDGRLLQWDTNPSNTQAKQAFSISNNPEDFTITDMATASSTSINTLAASDSFLVSGDDSGNLAVMRI